MAIFIDDFSRHSDLVLTRKTANLNLNFRMKSKVEILFEDEHYIAVTKPSGLLVHPYKKETNETENLMKWVKEKTGHYLYPFHRLDRPVSGVILFGLHPDAVRKIQEVWRKPSTSKEYLALARGAIEGPGEYNYVLTDDKGVEKECRTLYWPLEQFEKTTLMLVEIKTGRKHQIRRHFAHASNALIGDTTYGKGRINQFFRDEYSLHRIFLHSYRMAFKHPFSEKITELLSPLPLELRDVLSKMGSRFEEKDFDFS